MTQTSTFEPEPKSLKIPAKIASEASFTDRKSTRLNSSHLVISYAVFCLKKKQNEKMQLPPDHDFSTDSPAIICVFTLVRTIPDCEGGDATWSAPCGISVSPGVLLDVI